MKVTIECEPKEIAALERELKGSKECSTRIPEMQKINSGSDVKNYLSQVMQVLGHTTATCSEENLGAISESAAKIGEVLVRY